MYVVSSTSGLAAFDRILIGYSNQFTYSVVGYHGSGFITYQEALSAVFLEGCVLNFPDFSQR